MHLKQHQKKANQRAAEASGDLIENKISDKIIIKLKDSVQIAARQREESKRKSMEIQKKRYKLSEE